MRGNSVMEAWKEELYHHGIKGMKWGVRRYQNEDGTRTALGKRHENEAGDRKSFKGNMHRALAKVYDVNAKTYSKSNKTMASINKAMAADQRNKALAADRAAAEKRANKKGMSDKQKKALKIGAAVAATAIASYGVYRLNKAIGDKNLERNKKIADKIYKEARASDIKFWDSFDDTVPTDSLGRAKQYTALKEHLNAQDGYQQHIDYYKNSRKRLTSDSYGKEIMRRVKDPHSQTEVTGMDTHTLDVYSNALDRKRRGRRR